MMMDLLSKLVIVEKNILTMIDRIIHQYHITLMNNEYHNIYHFRDDTQKMYSDGLTACNYRELRYIDPSEDGIFGIRNDIFGDPIEKNCAFPFRYCYSSGKNDITGYK